MDSLIERYLRSARGQSAQYSRDLAGRLALQLHLVDHGIRDALTDASPLVRDARRGWRSGRVRDVMAGNFDLLSDASPEGEAGARG